MRCDTFARRGGALARMLCGGSSAWEQFAATIETARFFFVFRTAAESCRKRHSPTLALDAASRGYPTSCPLSRSARQIR